MSLVLYDFFSLIIERRVWFLDGKKKNAKIKKTTNGGEKGDSDKVV